MRERETWEGLVRIPNEMVPKELFEREMKLIYDAHYADQFWESILG